MNRLITGMRRLMSVSRTALQRVSKGALVAMMLIVVASALGRYLFSAPIPNMVNIVELLLLPAVIWFFVTEVQLSDQNITMDLVSNRLSEGVNNSIKILFYPFFLGILFIAFSDLLSSTIELWNDQVWSSGTIAIPAWLSRGIVTLGVLILIITILVQLVQWIISLEPVQSTYEYMVH